MGILDALKKFFGGQSIAAPSAPAQTEEPKAEIESQPEVAPTAPEEKAPEAEPSAGEGAEEDL